MKWSDLSHEAQSILEWQEHVLTGKPQTLVIERGKEFYQRCHAFSGDVKVFVDDELFVEIQRWLPFDNSITYNIDDDKITTEYREEILSKLN